MRRAQRLRSFGRWFPTRGVWVIFPSPSGGAIVVRVAGFPAWAGQGGGCLAGAEDLDDLPGAEVADQQAAVRRDRDRQRMREAGGEVTYLAALARTRA